MKLGIRQVLVLLLPTWLSGLFVPKRRALSAEVTGFKPGGAYASLDAAVTHNIALRHELEQARAFIQELEADRERLQVEVRRHEINAGQQRVRIGRLEVQLDESENRVREYKRRALS